MTILESELDLEYKPKVISFFAGCGGSSLGYTMAGCKVVMACDWEKKATDVYKLNFPDTPVITTDIREVNAKVIKDITGIDKGELDILDGSPPCTPFSIAGSREKKWGKVYQSTADSREQRSDDLFFEYIRIVKELMPKVFVAENVAGLIIGKARIFYFNRIIKNFKQLGYDVEAHLLDASDYGVAQSRRRVIIIGFRKDCQFNKNEQTILTFQKQIQPKTLFIHAVSNLINPKNELDHAYKRISNSSHSTMFSYMKPGKNGSSVHPKQSLFNTSKADPLKPCPTITTSARIIHPTEQRMLTLSELKRCASFPDDFKFPENKIAESIARIGNSVPPLLMKAIALYIKSKLN